MTHLPSCAFLSVAIQCDIVAPHSRIVFRRHLDADDLNCNLRDALTDAYASGPLLDTRYFRKLKDGKLERSEV